MRIFHLLHLLISEQIVSSEYLAKLLNVSSRTIRTDLKELSALLSTHGATIKSLKGAGYQLEIHDEQRFRHLLKQLKENEAATPQQVSGSSESRHRFLIRKLLLTEEYFRLEDLADLLFVSRPTIQNDIREVRRILKNYGLTLENRPHYGVKIKGSETQLRYCMSDYIFSRTEIAPESTHSPSILSDEEMDLIREVILERIEVNDIILSDIALNNLVIHIAIACKRIRDERYVSFYPQEMKKIEAQKEFGVASEIVSSLERKMNHSFPFAEVAYIAVHLLGVRTIVAANMDDTEIKGMIDGEIYDLAVEILDHIEKGMQLGIRHDKELLVALCLHLKPVINRFRYGMNLRNPMLDEIKSNYPLAFEAGILAGETIRKRLGFEIEENEIGYLAIHIGAAIERKKEQNTPKRCLIVCASGRGSAKLLYYKLQSVFGSKLDIVGTTEFYKLKQMPLDSLDFVISTIPVSEKLSVPIIHVNTFLGGTDVDKIEQAISETGLPAIHYIRKKLVFLQQKMDSKEEVLAFMVDRIKEAGLVKGPFLESVLEREAMSPTSFGNFVAIPHPMEPFADSTFWAVCTLLKPIDWDGKPVQFVCVLCMQRSKTEDVQSMYNILLTILNNEALVQQLIKCKTYSDFARVLHEHA
ncbi:BglG family transcription antiterminator [Paenibacillus sp. FSL K6-1230]|uniref:BglG family transcription antiterminator n=1 Tax=Paenibacillus sp. FSL K6-1230 TaxID=2921603 RepID=UPI0030F5E0D5